MINTVTHQGLLLPILYKLFPGEDILVNSRRGSSIKNPVTGRYLELDLWIPKHHLCFEFQDSYHYTSTWYSHASLNEVRQRDGSKHDSVRGNADTLIVVSCWWRGDPDSLSSSIAFARQDLMSGSNEEETSPTPIPLNPPVWHFEDCEVPNIGELMLASFTPRDFSFRDSMASGVQWWMGEKYDGIRCCWSPPQSVLYLQYARFGRILLLGDNYIRSAPRIFLDGEVWFGRTQFSSSMKFMTEALDAIQLQHLRIISFDFPESVSSSPFECRYKLLLRDVSSEHSFVIVAPRVLCESQKQIADSLHIVLSNGGEGVILQKAESTYEHGRSASLFKIKSATVDYEGLVTEVSESEIKLQLPTGEALTVPIQNVHLTEAVRVGDVVTISCDSHSRSSALLNVTVTRIRRDLLWEDLVHTGKTATARDANVDARSVFEEYAKSHDLDPLLPSTWYFLSQLPTSTTQEGKALLSLMEGGLVNTLMQLFPFIGLEESKFYGFNFKSNHWKDVHQRRRGMVEYARQRGFSHKIPENWYTLTSTNIHDTKVLAILQHYSGSVKRALSHLFPEIGLNRHRFLPRKFWNEEEYRRQFLENFAAKEKFEHQNPESWYSVRHDVFLMWQGARQVLSHHGNSLAKAIRSLFPGTYINESKFLHLPKSYWQSEANRRNFFVEFAKSKNFDPLVPGNWYSIKRSRIVASKNADRVLSFYNHSVARALVEVFPDISLDINKFSYRSSTYWKVRENRKKFFERCALENQVDPLVPSNWYKLFAENKIDIKGQIKLLEHYNYNVPDALADVFPAVKFDVSRFTLSPNNYWEDATNRRRFFEGFATEHRFDPLDVDQWYQKRDIFTKEARGVMTYYKGSLQEALADTFPECTVADSKFMYQQRNFWQTRENRRRVFENYARENHFDPHSPNEWYSIDKQQFVATKGAQEALYFHNGSIARAINELFPSIGINKSKFIYKRGRVRPRTQSASI